MKLSFIRIPSHIYCTSPTVENSSCSSATKQAWWGRKGYEVETACDAVLTSNSHPPCNKTIHLFSTFDERLTEWSRNINSSPPPLVEVHIIVLIWHTVQFRPRALDARSRSQSWVHSVWRSPVSCSWPLSLGPLATVPDLGCAQPCLRARWTVRRTDSLVVRVTTRVSLEP